MASKLRAIQDERRQGKQQTLNAERLLVYKTFGTPDGEFTATIDIEDFACRAVKPVDADDLAKFVLVGVRGDMTLNAMKALVVWVEDMFSDA